MILKKNLIALQLLMVFETGDLSVTNAEYGSPDHRYNYLDLADKVILGITELFLNLENVIAEEKEIQYYLYEVGKQYFGLSKDDLNLWFKCLYAILFGYENGPRIGVFINLFGIPEFLDKLEENCTRPLCLVGII